MSISSEIARLKTNVSNSLSAISEKGVAVPEGANSDNLPELISQITGGAECNPFSLSDDGDGNVTIESCVFTVRDDGEGNVEFIPTTMLIESEEDGNIVLR